MLRLCELLATERQHLQDLVGTERIWEGDYYRDVTAAMKDQLKAEQVASEAEQARLSSHRDGAQARWQQLARVAEQCRVCLGLPVDGRRG